MFIVIFTPSLDMNRKAFKIVQEYEKYSAKKLKENFTEKEVLHW